MCENMIKRSSRKTDALTSAVGVSDKNYLLDVKLLPEHERIDVRKSVGLRKRKSETKQSREKRKLASDADKRKKKIPRELPYDSEAKVHNSSCGEDETTFEESIEKARALSRLYSQRNRDKLKNTIDELTQEKDRLSGEHSELQAANRQIQNALKAAEAENQLLRQQHLFHSQIMAQPTTTISALPRTWNGLLPREFVPQMTGMPSSAATLSPQDVRDAIEHIRLLCSNQSCMY